MKHAGVIIVFVVVCIMPIIILVGQQQSHNPHPLYYRYRTRSNISSATVPQQLRNKIIMYSAERGDTLALIANKFEITVETIKCENKLASNAIHVGQILRMLPITGITHIVAKGDTIESIAVKYHTSPQNIKDNSFNKYAVTDTDQLIVGDTLVVPNGRCRTELVE